MDIPVAIVPFAQEFCSVKNIQLVKKTSYLQIYTRGNLFIHFPENTLAAFKMAFHNERYVG